MIQINAHVLAIMLGLTFVIGAVIGRLAEMWISRHKHAELLTQLEALNRRLDVKPAPLPGSLYVVGSRPRPVKR